MYIFIPHFSGKEKWIDFESEISEVIQSLDKNMHNQGVENAIESIINNHHTRYCIYLYHIFLNFVEQLQ